jgi:hypothetical protein
MSSTAWLALMLLLSSCDFQAAYDECRDAGRCLDPDAGVSCAVAAAPCTSNTECCSNTCSSSLCH